MSSYTRHPKNDADCPVSRTFYRYESTEFFPVSELGLFQLRTETVKDDLNPIFQTKISLDYFFEERQMLEFGVYDCDDPTKRDLSYHESLGTAQSKNAKKACEYLIEASLILW